MLYQAQLSRRLLHHSIHLKMIIRFIVFLFSLSTIIIVKNDLISILKQNNYNHNNNGISIFVDAYAFIGLKQQRSNTRFITNHNTNMKIITTNDHHKHITKLYGKNWDQIILDDEDIDEDELTKISNNDLNIPMDMKYNKRNCERSNQNFLKIMEANGPVHDIYCRRITNINSTDNNPFDFDQDVFWYIGKVCHISDVTILDCIYRQYDLILYHAAYLRPLELYTRLTSNSLQLWYTNGNSEIEVASNNPNIIFQYVPYIQTLDVTAIGKIRNNVKTSYIGFQGEVYTMNEEGFRTMRKSDGTPANSEVGRPPMDDDDDDDSNDNENYDDLDEFRMPTDEEMEKLYKELEGKDINDMYEEQEKRKQ